MILSRILIIFILFFIGPSMPEQNTNLELIDYFSYAESIIVYKDSNTEEYNKHTPQFDLLLDSFLITCEGAHEMPAFGVSLHNETILALTKGTWIEFKFNKSLTHNEMPFSRLLIEVNGEYSGFNIIRYHNEEYSGRCFYFNLNTNMQKLYNTIVKM